eukprot:scaffold127083_cov66-Phaeocystis_antarctica.AAC.3
MYGSPRCIIVHISPVSSCGRQVGFMKINSTSDLDGGVPFSSWKLTSITENISQIRQAAVDSKTATVAVTKVHHRLNCDVGRSIPQSSEMDRL